MAVAFSSKGTTVYSTGNPAPAYGVNYSAGDMAVLVVTTKPDTASTTVPVPGFNKLCGYVGGGGTTGADTGPMRVEVFFRICDGTETAASTVTVTNANNSASSATILRYTNSTGKWRIRAGGGTDTTAGTTWSVTCDNNFGITSGDELLGIISIPTDVSTPSQFSAESITATSATIGSMTEREELDTISGNDLGGVLFTMSCSAGTSSAAPVMTATAGGTTTNVTGVGVIVGLREVSHSEEVEDFDGGTSGNTYGTTTGLSDGGSGTATSTYNTNSAYEGARGHLVASSSGVILQRQLNFDEPSAMAFGLIAVGLDALPSSTLSIAQLRDASLNTFVVLRIDTAGNIILRDNATNRATAAAPLTAGGPKRLIGFGCRNGRVMMRLYNNNGTTVEDESTLFGNYTSGGIELPLITEMVWGAITTPGSAVNWDFDLVGWSKDDWVNPQAGLTLGAAAAANPVVSGVSGDAHITYQAAGTVPLATTVAGDVTGLLLAAGSTAAVSAVSGAATKTIPQAAGQIDLATTVAGTVTAKLQALGVTDSTTTVTGTITSKLQAAGVIAASAATSGAITVIMPAAGVVTATSGVSGDATLVVGNQAAGTVVCTSGVVGNASLVAAAAGTVPAVTGVVGNATRVPIVYSAAGTVAGVTGVSGDATRVLQTLAAAGTVAVVSTTAGNATRVLQTLAAAGTVAATTTVAGDATRVPIVYAAAGVVVAVATVGGDASIVIPPTPGGPGLLVPLSPDRDRDLARR